MQTFAGTRLIGVENFLLNLMPVRDPALNTSRNIMHAGQMHCTLQILQNLCA